MASTEEATTSVVSTSLFFSKESTQDCEKEDATEAASIGSLLKLLGEEERLSFYDVTATCDWIKMNEFKRVALQLPDAFLADSVRVAEAIERQTHSKTFILADTSYRSCCVDEVAAEHARCDSLVHFGDACLSSSTRRLPTRFVFGALPVPLQSFSSQLLRYRDQIPKESLCVLIADAPFCHILDSLASVCQEVLPNEVFVANFAADVSSSSCSLSSQMSFGRELPLDFSSRSLVCVLFVGVQSSALIALFLLSFPNCSHVLHFDPSTASASFQQPQTLKSLRRRLFLAEKLKDAHTVGIVVGSLAVDGCHEAIDRARTLCKKAGKKAYVISVGKVNVPKLSNFSTDIDVFVLLSCPFGVLLDSSAFFRPVLSLFEAEVALNPTKASWSADGLWTSEFRRFIHDEIGEAGESLGDVSLVSGKLRVQHDVYLPEHDSSVALYTAGDYFSRRSWKGLDDSARLDESTRLEEGRKGVASGYTQETLQ